MLKVPVIGVFFLLSSCSVPQVVEQSDGIWHSSSSLGEFTDSWSACHQFRATTSDLEWLISVDVSHERGAFYAAEMVSLLSFAHTTDRECAVSLYRFNDIACDDQEPVVFLAARGDGRLAHREADHGIGSTFDLEIRDLVFVVGDEEIRIDRLRFSDVRYSNFCAG